MLMLAVLTITESVMASDKSHWARMKVELGEGVRHLVK